MAHNVYLSPGTSGTWSLNQVLAPAGWTTLDTQLFAAIDGDDGGAWTPSTVPIDIGGLGLRARLRMDLIATMPDADHTYAITSTREIVADSTMTASRAATLSATGALLGDVMTVYADASMSTSYLLTVKDDTGTAIRTVGTSLSADSPWATFRFNGSHWVNLGSARSANRIVALPASVTLATLQDTTATSFGTGFVASFGDSNHGITLTALIGDIIEASLVGGIATVDSTAGIFAQLAIAVVDGGATSQLAIANSFSLSSTYGDGSNTGKIIASLTATHSVGTAGAVIIKPQYITSNASHGAQVDGTSSLTEDAPCCPLTLRVVHYRP